MILDIEHKPIPVITDTNSDVRFLIDTGATISVFTQGLELFKKYFPNASLADKKYLLGGFGGKSKVECDIYIVPELCIENMVIRNLPIAISFNKYISSEIVLSAYVFKKNRLTIDFDNDKVEVLYSRPICCILTPSEIDSNYAGGFAVFTQE